MRKCNFVKWGEGENRFYNKKFGMTYIKTGNKISMHMPLFFLHKYLFLCCLISDENFAYFS